MTAKMKLVHITCAFLAIAICSLANGNPVPNGDKVSTIQQTTPYANISSNLTKDNTKETTTPVPVASSITPDATANNNNVTTVPTQNVPTHDVPTTTAQPQSPTTQKNITTVKPTTTETPTTTKIPSTSTVTVAPTKSSTTVVPPASTTPVPLSTIVPTDSPHKERHFDGLSFLGGIILATCLMAIAAFSWKFYTTCNERNYRTL